MSEGLKELKRLPKAIKDTFKDSFNIIKKELKEYEVLGDEFQAFIGKYNKLCEEKMEWLKQKEALEIIKKKEVDVALLKYSENVERYNVQIEPTHLTIQYYVLTQEEYNLLKEVLL